LIAAMGSPLEWSAAEQAAVLLSELFLVVLGAFLTRGEAVLQQALFDFVPSGPLGLNPA
jgi:hypothetical protein